MSGSPGLSRWDACRDRGILPGMPGPAETATPSRRCPDLMFNVPKAALRQLLSRMCAVASHTYGDIDATHLVKLFLHAERPLCSRMEAGSV